MNQNYDPTRQQSGNPWSSPTGGPPQQYPGGGNMQSGRDYYPSQLNAISIIQTVLGSLEILGGIFPVYMCCFCSINIRHRTHSCPYSIAISYCRNSFTHFRD